jgi:hypothetical protein
VDDRFRPIQLTNEVASTEFQAKGFILLQETGQQVLTTQNGEFSFVDLDPGTYTLRATIQGHEATPIQVTVAEGVFNEASIVARRVSSLGSSVITQEFSAFTPCAADFIANGVVANCVLDLSGDTYRPGFSVNYTGIADVTYLVAEAKMSQVSGYNFQMRENDGSAAGGDRYAVGRIKDGDYIKMVLERGVANEEHNEQNNNVAWGNNETNPMHTIFFMEGDFRDEMRELGFCCGLGARFGMKGQFLHSMFVGEPEVDIAAYCVLCGA